MSVPFQWAGVNGVHADGFVILTDNETWAGGYQHPSQALSAYRRALNPQARVAVASMTAAGYTIADPKDEGVLQIAGLDASLPRVIGEWLR